MLHANILKKTSPYAKLVKFWRRDRDSNPRTLSGQRFSRPPLSTAQPSLHIFKRVIS